MSSPLPSPSPAPRDSRFVRLARACNRHRWRTFGAWVLALVVVQLLASAVGTKQISSFRLPGTESQRAYDLLAEHFPAAKGDTDQVVFRARTGTLSRPRDEGAHPGGRSRTSTRPARSRGSTAPSPPAGG